MPSLFVPEERWAPGSWGVNHPLTVDAQIHHGLAEAGYGYWGFSPSNIPEGGYDDVRRRRHRQRLRAATRRTRPHADRPRVARLPGPPAQPDPPPSAYTNGVVTPHAAFLGLRYRPHAAVDEPRRLERDFDVYTRWGFLDSVNVDTGEASDSYLSLDQGMIMAALGNALGHDVLRRAFATRGRRARAAAGDRRRGVRRLAAAVHDHRHAGPRPAARHARRRRDLRPRRRRHDRRPRRRRRGVRRRGRDRIEGGDGDDTLYGGEGDDRLDGGRGRDVRRRRPA